MFNAQEKSMQDFHISTYPFPHCTDFKHSLPSIFPCSCFSANQRPARMPSATVPNRAAGRLGKWSAEKHFLLNDIFNV